MAERRQTLLEANERTPPGIGSLAFVVELVNNALWLIHPHAHSLRNLISVARGRNVRQLITTSGTVRPLSDTSRRRGLRPLAVWTLCRVRCSGICI